MLERYPAGTRVWLPDSDLGWIAGSVVSASENSASGSFELKLKDARGKESTVQSSNGTNSRGGAQAKVAPPPLRNPPDSEACNDLATLNYLNEPSVLHAIQTRYASRTIYTYSGLALIAVNSFQRVPIYGPDFIHKYSNIRRGADSDAGLEPHLFAVAEDARLHMRANGVGQTIIVSGDSGAGKTESAKLIMRFLASRTTTSGEAGLNSGIDEAGEVERRMLATNPILEAFGNAKTVHNDNSSRFGKYLQILFDRESRIVGAQIRTYLLERSRLVFQSDVERNFHIFYQLFAGLPANERSALKLGQAADFSYLQSDARTDVPVTTSDVPDDEQFRATQKALSTVDIDSGMQRSIWKLLAAILHLGNIKVTELRGNADVDAQDPALAMASSLLGIAPEDLRKWMIKRQISARSERIVTSLNAAQSASVRDSIAKFVYSRMFDWLITIVNESLAGEDGLGPLMADSFIGILDIYGFEYYPDVATSKSTKRGRLVNSFEQFCINYANERLQHEFNAHVFKLEQDEYIREGIKWSFIDFPDNQPCIDAIESKLGIISLLDEESRLASGSDSSFIMKVVNQWAPASKPDSVVKRSRFGGSGFIISHYAANVTYESAGFIEKNRDALPDEHLEMLDTTTNELLRRVLDVYHPSLLVGATRPFSPARSESDFGGSPTAQGFEQSNPNSNRLGVHAALNSSTSSRPATPNSMEGSTLRSEGGVSAGRKQTLGAVFKSSLASLMDTISMTNPHYVRCIKPNREKKAWVFDSKHVLSQLRACGILETVRISCAGYPSRWTYDDFASRYYLIMPPDLWTPWPAEPRSLCQQILQARLPDKDKYQFGKTKIFFRSGCLAEMDAARSAKAEWLLALVRRNMIRYRARKYLRDARRAVVTIQRWWRHIVACQTIAQLRGEALALARQRVARAKQSNGPDSTPSRARPPRAKQPPRAGTRRYHPRTSSTLKDNIEEHFLVWPSDSFPDLQQSTMGPRQAIDVPRDSINIQARAWPTANGAYVGTYRGIWNLRAMAMKQLKSQSEPEDLVARFHKEIQAWSRLKHNNVCPFIGVFVNAERSIYLVEPWSQNGDITHYLRSIRPSADRVALLSQIARGLAYLHEESVIHGDLRGANIAINDMGEAVLSDIGVFRISLDESNGSALATGLIEAGAARWMAPELLDPHVEHLKMSKETDVYAFSMTAIELYTGGPPLSKIKEAKIPTEILSGTRPERPPIITAPSIQITESLWTLVQRCWVRAPASRPTALHIKHKLLAERSRR